MLQLAAIIEKTAAGGRGEDDRKIAGCAIKRVVPAVLVAPRNLAVIDLCRIGIDGGAVVVDPDLKARAARRIGAGDRRLTADGGGGDRKRQGADSRRHGADPS